MFAYIRLQLLNKWRGYNPSSYRKVNQSKAKAIIGYVGFTVLALYMIGLLVWMELMLFNQFAAIGQPDAVLAVGFLAATAMTLIYGFFGLTGQLFFARDTSFISALPISSRGVLSAKTLMVVISEACLSLVICATLIIRLGIYHGAGALFYVKAFLACVFVPVIPLTLALLLSFLLIRLSRLWKRREGMTTIFSFLLVVGIMLLSMSGQNMDEAGLQAMLMNLLLGSGSLTDMLLKSYPPLQWACDAMFTGGVMAWGKLALFIGVSALALGLVIWLLGKRYLPLAAKQEETLRRINEGHRKDKGWTRQHKPLEALLRQELREVITVPAYATNCLMGIIMFPMMVIIMWVSVSQSIPTGVAQFITGLLPRDFYLAGAIAGMCLVNTMCQAVSTSVSREGKRHDMRKTYPIGGMTHLMAKVLTGMVLNLITAITTGVALMVMLPAYWAETAIAMLVGQIFNFAWCAVALMIEVAHPRLQWKNEMEPVKQNPNGVLSMLVGLGMVVVLGGIVWLCLYLNVGMFTALVIAIIVMIAGAVLAGWMLKHKTAKAYYLQ